MKAEKSKQLLAQSDIHNRWKSDYLNSDMDEFYDLVMGRIVERLTPRPRATLLDAGCGYGYHTLRLAQGGFQIIGVDLSPVALQAARENVNHAGLEKQIRLEVADVTALPFPDEYFDYVFSWGVLMHVPEFEIGLAQLARVLKRGGKLVLGENNAAACDVAIVEPSIWLLKRLMGWSVPDRLYSERGIEEWAEGEVGGLMVRKTNMPFLDEFLCEKGLHKVDHLASQFTELYTRLPSRVLKRLVYRLNRIYFERLWNPKLALGNIVIFEKN